MNYSPDLEQLKVCISSMAIAMKMESLPDERCDRLISHILYAKEYDGIEGKSGWECLCNKIITERELRDLLMAHCSIEISRFNKLEEVDYGAYASKALSDMFEVALFPR
jgi:hypothetical protein